MNKKTAIVITSISAPNKVLKSIAKGAKENNTDFILIGDVPSPKDFLLMDVIFTEWTDKKIWILS